MYSAESDVRGRSAPKRGVARYLGLGQIAGQKPIRAFKGGRRCAGQVTGAGGAAMRCATQLSRYNADEYCSICQSRNLKSGKQKKKQKASATTTP